MHMKNKLFANILLTIFVASVLAACLPVSEAEESAPPLRVGFTEWWGDYALGFLRSHNLGRVGV